MPSNVFRWEFTRRRSRLHLQPSGDRAHAQRQVGGGVRQRLQQPPGTGTGHAFCTSSTSTTARCIRKIDTGAGDTTTPNGLATPAVVDFNGDAIVDYVYAGDLRGNMWKFDLTSTQSGELGGCLSDHAGARVRSSTATDGAT